MELKQVKGDTWYFEAEELIPLYRLPGDRCVLLDSGLLSERESLVAGLEEHGLTPVGVFGSHAHRDHSVNHFYLRERWGAKVSLPAGEAALCSSLLMYKAAYDTYSPRFLEEMYGSVIGAVDETVGPADGPVNFCGVEFQVIHTPGHTPDHICTVTPDGVCYVADALLSGPVLAGAKLPYHYGHEEARRSMEKLRGVRYDAYLMAHKGVERELGPVIEGNLSLLDAKGAALLTLLEGEMTLDQFCAVALPALKLVSGRPDRAAMFARNIRCFLDYLLDQGRLEIVVRDGLRRYRKTK